ncbi:hypothetical protein C8C77_11345 [Halanaerobium saccharolyticum]|uniref:OLD protein-like TOPRIM domain-containing protein n=1 Tax=Halanaerobium saccharolyticum TaxID=43595 RepID=A0A4R7YY54_9FIRM|nr:TOPRIM nucleotidyl transferase/hydrolase domain-containing protein [Halanaerobium saccharolyticum]RAK07499.1 hypothetical protein C7958_11445 [Halanaerobium saccharolyticum]TDW03076.1 hypothetical protein C8C77_11345 [Halanaerobium saccharolyticum]TDX59372.1 hypothetical protein C7956_11545 [Halanaerobium saccharolyticum]
MYKRLYILVEGNDDERFFNEIIKPLFKDDYDHIIIWQYAQQKYKNIKKFIASINSMGADYFFVGDLDENNCVIEKKRKVLETFDYLAFNRIIVVIKEIESWYLAGLDGESSNSLGIKSFKNTDELFKEDFNDLIATKYDSRIDFMREVLKIFSIETAVQKNKSINYFLNKFTSIM